MDELVANGYIAKRLHLHIPLTQKELGVLRSFDYIRHVPGYAKPTYFDAIHLANLVRGDYSTTSGSREAYSIAENEFYDFLMRSAQLIDLNTGNNQQLLEKLLHIRNRIYSQNSELGAKTLHLLSKEAKRALWLFGKTGLWWYVRHVHPKIIMSEVRKVYDRDWDGFWSFRSATRSRHVEKRARGYDKYMWFFVRGKYQEVMRHSFSKFLRSRFWGPEIMRHMELMKLIHAVFAPNSPY